jgi:DnaK suppressor protein
MKLETQTHLTKLRDMLNYRLADLQSEVHAAQQARLGLDGSERGVTDRKDEAEAEREDVIDEAQKARDLAELHQVEAALQRLDAGRYGDCADCGEPIPWARLLTQPAAERCAACQGALEQRAA